MKSNTPRALLVCGLVAAAAAGIANAGGGMGMSMGKATTVRHAAFTAFYDGHKDLFLNLDSSSKAEATAEHINYAPGLALVSLKTPEIYFVMGSAAHGQVAVLGSEPGESDYSPIWREVHLTFKAGQTPVLITSDTQVDKLVKQGVLTEQETAVRLNCPVVKVKMG